MLLGLLPIGDLCHPTIEGIKVEDLQILKDIKEITGFLYIYGAPVKDLSFLSGLETIYGRKHSFGSGITLSTLHVEWLGLTSLKKVWNGDVRIVLNSHLCYIEDLDLSPILAFPYQKFILAHNKGKAECDAQGLKCHSECSAHGCWGPGPDKCLKCKAANMAVNNTCLATCDDVPMVYQAENNACKQCHIQCAGGCSGPGPDQCFDCKKVKVLGQNKTFECMTECPMTVGQLYLYPGENGICRQCDTSCDKGYLDIDAHFRRIKLISVTQILTMHMKCTCFLCVIFNAIYPCHVEPSNTDDLKDDDAHMMVNPRFKDIFDRQKVCQPCYHLCLECNGPGNANCPLCRYYKYTNIYSICLKECPVDTYPYQNQCLHCNDQCLDGCRGTQSQDCYNCLNFKVFVDEDMHKFSCVEKCPDDLPHLVEDKDLDKPTMTVCASDDHPEVKARDAKRKDEKRQHAIGIAIAVGLPVFIVIISVACCCVWKCRRQRIQQMAKRTEVVDTEVPLVSGALNKEIPQPIPEKQYGHRKSASDAKQQRDEVDGRAPQKDEVDGRAPQKDEVDGRAPQKDKVDGRAPQKDEVDGRAPQKGEVDGRVLFHSP
ncbi:receptor tyrosine-protein kinase erbB-3-like [Ruditapes philippinarum]|uniref:receptor tyrosine-protein kinase erbB-3-like n=1 Tax=Ruditapes philippinarum TaxID=129788 RepID=UPI00295AA076|nr:receptor tyrosine-protein kinase erbB-3-like [Ruditapes philippinarum]